MTATTIAAPQPMPELAQRVRPIEGIRQSLTLAWRSIVQVRHNPWELGDFSIQPIMFVLLFTFVFGGAIGNGLPGSPEASGVEKYLQFMLPGMLVMNMLFVTLYVGQGLNTDITKGVFDRLQSLPIARWAPLAGRILADQIKQLWSIILVLVVGFVLGFSLTGTVGGLFGAIALMLGFALCFSWVSVLVGITAKDPERVQIFGFTAMFPITFVSNVFAPAESMPGWLQGFVDVNPVSLISDAVRGMMLGGEVAEPLLGSIIWALAILAVFAPLSVWAFKRRV